MELTAGEVKLTGRKTCRCYCSGSWAPGSWFPCGALNEVITSINSGIDQLGEPWRGDAVSDPSPLPLSSAVFLYCHLLCQLFSFVAGDSACPFHLPLDGKTSFYYLLPDPQG